MELLKHLGSSVYFAIGLQLWPRMALEWKTILKKCVKCIDDIKHKYVCFSKEKETTACVCHEVQIIKMCGKHNNFYLFYVYWNPDADDGIFDCLLVSRPMTAIQKNDRKASFVFIGDFNAHRKEWLNSISQLTAMV